MSAVAVFGNWPPVPHIIGFLNVSALGVILYQTGECVLSIVHTGTGAYEVNTNPARIGSLAAGPSSPAQAELTCIALGGTIATYIHTGPNQIGVLITDAAGAPVDSIFALQFNA